MISLPPQPGDRAPDFTLQGTHGTTTLSEVLQEKKVVLAFYVEDGTPTWIRELASLREEYPTIQELGAEVLAISVDTLESHQRFAEREGGFPFPLLSDPELAVAHLYNVVDEGGRKARRAVFVIGQESDILHALPYYNPANSDQFFEIFQALGLQV